MASVLQRVVEGPRLAYYKEAADGEYWDTHWAMHLSASYYKGAERGYLGWFKKPFTQYLPSDGRILEAGCGPGYLVLALQTLGYQVEGIEWGNKTVEAVHKLHPELSIRVGDVTNINVEDNFYQGYISLGVVEHRKEGPEPYIREAYRVLAPGGIAFISVPYFNSLRRIKANLGLYRGTLGILSFYQYAFSDEEITSILEDGGFEVIDRMAYDAIKGIKDEVSFISWLFSLGIAGEFIRKWLPRILSRIPVWVLVEQRFGHMLLLVCRKL